MATLCRRLVVIALGGVAGAAVVGLLAETPIALTLGIVILGLGMVLAIQGYLLKPLPSILSMQSPDWPTPVAKTSEATVSDLDAHTRRIGQPVGLTVAVDNTKPKR